MLNCEEFASTVGSAAHNIIFLRDGTKAYLIPRANFITEYQLALDQVKVLFPDIDKDILGKADAVLVIDDGKLVSPAPAETVQDSPDDEKSTKESPVEASPVEK